MTKTIRNIVWVLALIGLGFGLVGMYMRFVNGHQIADYGSYVPWGLWVAGYIYLIGLSAGAFLLSTLTYVFGVKQLKSIGKLALFTALTTLIGAMILVWVDLGHPLRAWKLMFSTNFTSMMGWMAWFYTSYFILLMVELWFAMRSDLAKCADEPGFKGSLCRFLTFGRKDVSDEAAAKDQRTLRVLGLIGVPLAVAFHGGVGALFGVVGARPFWHGGLTPIVFLIGALASGGALLAFITAVWGPGQGTQEHRDTVVLLGRIVLGLILFDVLLEWAEFSTGLISAVPEVTNSITDIMFGNYWWAFWLVHLLIGTVAPILLLVLKPKSVGAIATAGFLIAVTFLTVRLNIVLPALAQEELDGLDGAFSGPGLSFDYFPSVWEWLVMIFVVSLCALIFQLGYQFLPIVREKEVA